MPSPELKLANTSVCPRCGAGLRCGMVAGDAECWCVQLPHVMPVPPLLPELALRDSSAATCLCPACLKQITDVSIHAPAQLARNLEELAPLSPINSISLEGVVSNRSLLWMNEKMHFQLPTIESTADASLQARLRHKIDHKTKPLGALGLLEGLALQLGLIQRSESPGLQQPQMVVFAADHGIAAEGVSAFPQAVTVQMVGNMLAGGAAINVFARQHGFALQVVDAGVAAELPAHPRLLPRKIAMGTKNLCNEPAMSRLEAQAALTAGMDILQALPGNVVAFGEMGIANTSPAALLLARLTGASIEDATGRGTGLDDAQLRHKQGVLTRALARHPATQPLDAVGELAALGGFEIAMMAGAMLQAASERRLVLVDGFIAGAAALVAQALSPQVLDYLVFCHRSAETGHRLLLAHLQAKPLLELDLRLGEGTGALLAWPLVQSAANFLNEMASFESAGVSGKETA